MSSLILLLLLGLLVFVGGSSGAPSGPSHVLQIRSIGGDEDRRPHEYLRDIFYAGLFYRKPGYFALGEPHCGGVVWDNQTVLTAANCLSKFNSSGAPEQVEIYLGHKEWGIIDDFYLFKSEEIFIHPDYKKETSVANLAVIRLDRGIDLGETHAWVGCVCDPEPFKYLDTTKCISIGWGFDAEHKRPTNLMEVTLPIVDNAICAQNDPQFDPNSFVCAGSEKANVCNGDAGDPLVCPFLEDPSKHSLVGIVAYTLDDGAHFACGIKPSYFTKVDHYLEWIAEKAAPAV